MMSYGYACRRSRLLNTLWASKSASYLETRPGASGIAVHAKKYRTFATTPELPPTKVEKIILDGIKVTAALSIVLSYYTELSPKANGPISFATYMQMCLSHPTEGYYMNSSNPVFGARGDFITSPEISQMFGEVSQG